MKKCPHCDKVMTKENFYSEDGYPQGCHCWEECNTAERAEEIEEIEEIHEPRGVLFPYDLCVTSGSAPQFPMFPQRQQQTVTTRTIRRITKKNMVGVPCEYCFSHGIDENGNCNACGAPRNSLL